MGGTSRTAEVAYSKELGLELTVPHGTRLEEVAKLREALFTELVGRLPRGCSACLSGESLVIKERFEHVLFVNLDSMEVLAQ